MGQIYQLPDGTLGNLSDSIKYQIKERYGNQKIPDIINYIDALEKIGGRGKWAKQSSEWLQESKKILQNKNSTPEQITQALEKLAEVEYGTWCGYGEKSLEEITDIKRIFFDSKP